MSGFATPLPSREGDLKLDLEPSVLSIPCNGFGEPLLQRGARLVSQLGANLFVAADPARRGRFTDLIEVEHRGSLANPAEHFSQRPGEPKNGRRQWQRRNGPAGRAAR